MSDAVTNAQSTVDDTESNIPVAPDVKDAASSPDPDESNTKDTSDLLLDRLAHNCRTYAHKLAVAFITPAPHGGKVERQLTYKELDEETNRVAQLLINSGLAAEDRAVIVYPPSLDFLIAFLACLKAGVIAVPVFPPNPLRRDSLEMFSVIVASSGATVALTNASYNHQKKLASIKTAVTKFQRGTSKWPDALRWIVTARSQGSKTSSQTLELRNSSERSRTAFLQFTSGSTSDPKGVIVTQGNMAHNLTIITNELQAGDDTIVCSWLPQYHDMGLIGSCLGLLYCGGSGYYMSPLSFLQRPMLWLEAVSKHKATHLQAPNFAFKLTARKFETNEASESLDLSSVRHIINAAEPVDQESMDAFYNTFSRFGLDKVIYPTYGLAEHTVFVCSGGKQIITVRKKELEVDGKVVVVSEVESEATSKMIGCGYPSKQKVDVKIVDAEKLVVLGEDTVGEIWVNSASKASGYYQKPKESAEDFHAVVSTETKDTGGYLRTGDLGFVHQDELFICGRLKDLIIVGGRNFYPQDLEATAEASSDLVRLGCSAAFTIDPTKVGGEEIAMIMELKEVPSTESLGQVCSTLATTVRSALNQEHSVGISTIAFLKTRTVPKTSSGKIARAWCRKGYTGKTLQIVYEKSFKSEPSSLEIEQTAGTSQTQSAIPKKKDAASIRAMSKEDILDALVLDISRVGSISRDSVESKVPLVAMLDSLTISQFKGMLENNYAVKISDEYLFRESTTITKLVEVVKLGYAPDDGDGGNAAEISAGSGNAPGLAGALGCPPGVVCTIQ